ncbi:hypothetical protein HMPREF9058_1767 [Actinomyces sp. oral taxon 175 str. F0384]|nr:hypothetical protein HMPREF9058_1767 [Actinomyces sp. oral taxon 175 str. F0384]
MSLAAGFAGAGMQPPGRIGDVPSSPGLRFPPGHWGRLPVIWRRTQSSITKYVLDGGAGCRHRLALRPQAPGHA